MLFVSFPQISPDPLFLWTSRFGISIPVSLVPPLDPADFVSAPDHSHAPVRTYTTTLIRCQAWLYVPECGLPEFCPTVPTIEQPALDISDIVSFLTTSSLRNPNSRGGGFADHTS